MTPPKAKQPTPFLEYSHFDLGGLRYRITHFKMDAAHRENDEQTLGQNHHVKAVVRIAEGLTPDIEVDVRVHEMIHACFRQAGLQLEGNGEEEIVTRITPQIVSLFAQNPEQFEALARHFKERK